MDQHHLKYHEWSEVSSKPCCVLVCYKLHSGFFRKKAFLLLTSLTAIRLS